MDKEISTDPCEFEGTPFIVIFDDELRFVGVINGEVIYTVNVEYFSIRIV